MPYIEREGVQIHYEAAGSGPPVLITHGFGSSTKAWEGQAETLSDAPTDDAATLADERTLTGVALTGGVSSDIWRIDNSLRGPVCAKRALAKLRVAADWQAPLPLQAATSGLRRWRW